MDWEKKFGSDKLGASIGAFFENKIVLEVNDLDGSFEINVEDRVWATVKLGFINKNLDVVRAEACFRGGIGYDLNVFKDFGIDNIVELVTRFDKLFKNIFDRVKSAINGFVDTIKELINGASDFFAAARNGGLGRMFEAMVQAVKDLPARAGGFGNLVLGLLKKLASYEGIPVIAAAKRVVRRALSLYTRVKNDVMALYNAIVDAVTVDLPWAAKQIATGINQLWAALKSFKRAPGRSIQDILSVYFRVQSAITVNTVA